MEQRTFIARTYQERIHEAEQALHRVRKRISLVGLLRLALFVEAVVAFFFFGMERWEMLLIFSGFPLVAFIYLIKLHSRLFSRRDYLKKKIEVNEQELRAMHYDFAGFDAGQEFIDPAHLYTLDLDVFGEHSLFQYINRTATPVGKECLARWFNVHSEQKEEIERRQEAVKELTDELEYRQQIRTVGLIYKGGRADLAEIRQWAEHPVHYRKKRLLRLLPVTAVLLNTLCIGLSAFGLLPVSVAGMVFAAFVLTGGLFAKGVTVLQNTYGHKLQVLSIYFNQILLTEQKKMRSPALQALKRELGDGKEKASSALNRLGKLLNALDQRANILAGILLNGLMCRDLYIVMRIERWKEEHAADLPRWIEAIGEVEAYCSLATFAYNHPEYVYPMITAQSFRLRGKALGHPLMDRDKCVRNDIDVSEHPSFIIITGANMAGKSTYLRTVGVNYLLACIGAPVWADVMEICPVKLVTGLHTSDSLTDNESYFFAELKRLKLIIDKLKAGEKLFIILDEILKGTNSMDKQKGSIALIRQFVEMKTNGIIATHDLVLGTLADNFPQQVENHCFEADIVDNELSFSYRMRDGVAQNMNACFLMKKMGIALPDD